MPSGVVGEVAIEQFTQMTSKATPPQFLHPVRFFQQHAALQKTVDRELRVDSIANKSDCQWIQKRTIDEVYNSKPYNIRRHVE